MMSQSTRANPIPVAHLFPVLDKALMQLLQSLAPEEWHAPTLAKRWSVKDIVAHLLDGNIRTMSMQRDRYFGIQPDFPIDSYETLVEWLNTLNNDWVQAARRISPDVLMLLLEVTNPLTSAYYASLQPFEEAIFSVAWAGEDTSYNWMHLAREYTEKWHHQQQIREAVGKNNEAVRTELLTRELFYPVIAAFMRALPHTYRSTNAELGTLIQIIITGDIGDTWCLRKGDQAWCLEDSFNNNSFNNSFDDKEAANSTHTTISIPPEIAWKLFCKNLSPEQARPHIQMTGNTRLAEICLQMVAVMA